MVPISNYFWFTKPHSVRLGIYFTMRPEMCHYNGAIILISPLYLNRNFIMSTTERPIHQDYLDNYSF